MKAAACAVSLLQRFVSQGWRGRAVASFLAGTLKLFAPRGSRIESNLRLVYPESSEAWRREIRRRLYEHLGWMVTEILALQKDPEQAFSWVEKVEGAQWLNELLSSSRGAIILGAHFGNWELLGAWCAQTFSRHGKKIYVLVQSIRDPDIARLIDRYRERTGIYFLSKDTSTLELVRLLKSGGYVATMPDVSWLSGGVTLPFMGRPCTNTMGPAVLSILASAPIVPLGLYRHGPFRHALRCFPPLTVPAETKRRLRAELLTLKINEALERLIAPQPELWFWLHNRWK